MEEGNDEKQLCRTRGPKNLEKQGRWNSRSDMPKPSRSARCPLLNGSAWSTERKYMRRYQGTFDIFFGIEHRMRRDEMEEQFNKEAKQGWRFAADAARITDESAKVRIASTRQQFGSSN